MPIEQAIMTWIHLVSATIWVGGGLFLGTVLAPVLKKSSMPLEERITLMIIVGRRFNKIAIPSLIILISTGLYSTSSLLLTPSLLLETSYGIYLIIKILLVIAVIVTYAVHVKMISKKTENQIKLKKLSESQIQRLRKKIIILGEITTVLSVAILFFAALLDAGV